jgi:hypothetical protein
VGQHWEQVKWQREGSGNGARHQHWFAQQWEGANASVNDGQEGADISMNGGCTGPRGVRVPTAGRKLASIVDHNSEHRTKWRVQVWLGLSPTAGIPGGGSRSMSHMPRCRMVPCCAGAMDLWVC